MIDVHSVLLNRSTTSDLDLVIFDPTLLVCLRRSYPLLTPCVESDLTI
jgi:hypothetical protein